MDTNKQQVIEALSRHGVHVGSYGAVCINGKRRRDKPVRCAVARWPDGSWTVNLVEVPAWLALTVVRCGLAGVVAQRRYAAGRDGATQPHTSDA